MVESPTYYHAFNPVLRSLKAFNMENFPLQDEVVYALPSPSQEMPRYLSEDRSLDIFPTTSIAKRMEVRQFLETLKCDSNTALEESQCEALVHALKNKLAIIQG